MRATIQVNECGSWRNVASFDGVRARAVKRALRDLALALGERPTWRIKEEGSMKVWVNDEMLRSDVAEEVR